MTQLAAVDRKAFEDLLNSTGVQLVHFNGHGVWDSMGDLSALRLENNESIPAMAFSSRKLGMESHPILYLNACSVGRGAANVGRPGGFAASCLDGGWSGVIAPYWRVYDPYAMQFCLELYGKLILGYSVGEALQQIRRDRPNDYTAQSYSYFGDPGARMLFQ
jgi:CHAT domain-containing protein